MRKAEQWLQRSMFLWDMPTIRGRLMLLVDCKSQRLDRSSLRGPFYRSRLCPERAECLTKHAVSARSPTTVHSSGQKSSARAAITLYSGISSNAGLDACKSSIPPHAIDLIASGRTNNSLNVAEVTMGLSPDVFGL